MITGDHAVTAGAIAADLGIPGEAVTGADLDRIPTTPGRRGLARRLDDIGVVARVSPEHKIRIVRALQGRGDVVAMTGDGVNDAPALRKADIGVAMGVTGTEVTKEAATMILTDDNFATIVGAVREGRGIYDNIVKFVRFQLSTSLGFVITFLVASITGIAGGAPFTALQILFVNLVMDGPPAMSLGVDPVSPDAMRRPPRPAHERILTRPRLLRILLASAVMAAGTLAVLVYAPGPEPQLGVPTVAGTMAFVTFVFFQVFNLLNVRNDLRSVFSRETLENRSAFVATAAVIVLLVLIVEMDVAARVHDHHRPHLRPVARLRGDRLDHPVGRRSRQDRAAGPGTAPGPSVSGGRTGPGGWRASRGRPPASRAGARRTTRHPPRPSAPATGVPERWRSATPPAGLQGRDDGRRGRASPNNESVCSSWTCRLCHSARSEICTGP